MVGVLFFQTPTLCIGILMGYHNSITRFPHLSLDYVLRFARLILFKYFFAPSYPLLLMFGSEVPVVQTSLPFMGLVRIECAVDALIFKIFWIFWYVIRRSVIIRFLTAITVSGVTASGWRPRRGSFTRVKTPLSNFLYLLYIVAWDEQFLPST